jgi:hypothetical protein
MLIGRWNNKLKTNKETLIILRAQSAIMKYYLPLNRNQNFLQKIVTLSLGQEMHSMNKEHFVQKESINEVTQNLNCKEAYWSKVKQFLKYK